jgi:hypothetical protein
MVKKLDNILRLCSIFSPLVPLLIVVLRRKKLARYQAVIVIFVTVSFLTDLFSTYIMRGGNYYLLHGYGLLESAILIYFYYLVLKESKKVTAIVGAAFLAFYVVNSLTWEYRVFNTYGSTMECLLMIGFAMALFFQFYKEEEDIFIDQSPLFWMNIGILVYFSGAFFSFILSREILSGPMTWMLHNLCNVLKNLLFAIALWKVHPRNSPAS